MKNSALIALDDVTAYYGSTKALDKISLTVGEGEIVSLFGPNGAGKSTVLKTIFGLLPMASGKMFFRDQLFNPVSYEMPKKSFALVLQGQKILPGLTARENLEIGGFSIRNNDIINAKIEEMLEIFPMLRKFMNVRAGFLSGGEQQILALARSLIASPKIILLDEPSLGLSPKIAREVFRKIKEINKLNKVSFLVADHNLKLLLSVSHRGYYLENGKIRVYGELEQIFEKHMSKLITKSKLG